MSSLKRTTGSQANEDPNKKRQIARQGDSKVVITAKVQPASKEVIDPDGDLILVLPDAALQVSSKILCMTSEVFKAMLSTKFAEGNNNLVGGIRHVNLPGQCCTPCYSLFTLHLNGLSYVLETSLPH